jgi:hypothetical protein
MISRGKLCHNVRRCLGNKINVKLKFTYIKHLLFVNITIKN